MATKSKGVTVRTTAGKNARIEPVVRLEDLLQRMQQAPAKGARGGAAEGSAEVRQLAAGLEARIRAWRGEAAKVVKAAKAAPRRPPKSRPG